MSNNATTINILNEAKHEIGSLRRENEILRAKVEVLSVFERALNPHGLPVCPMGMQVDVKWSIDQEINRLSCEHKEVTVVEDGGHCNACGAHVHYDETASNWK